MPLVGRGHASDNGHMLSALFGVAFIAGGLLFAVWGHLLYGLQMYGIDQWPRLLRFAAEPWRAWPRRYDRAVAAVVGIGVAMFGAYLLAASVI